MNTQALVSRMDQRALPQWTPAPAGLLPGSGLDASAEAAPASRFGVIFRRYWWLALLIWALVAIPACIFIYKNVFPQYVATGSIGIAPMITDTITGHSQPSAFYTEYLRTQADLMKNPFVLQRAAEDIRLSKFDWFRSMPDQVNYLQKNVEVMPVQSTQNIQVSMTHKDAHAAKAIVDSILDAYDATRRAFEDKNLGDNLRILKELQRNTEGALGKAQDQLAALTADGKMSWSAEDRKVITDVLASAKQSRAKLQTERLAMESQLATIKSRELPTKETYMASIVTDNDPQIDQWTKSKIVLEMNDKNLETHKATPQHPERASLRKQIKTMEQRIADRRSQIQDNAWSFYKAGFELERANKTVQLESDLSGLAKQIASLDEHVITQEKLASELGSKSLPIAALREQIAEHKDALKRYTDRIDEIENQNRAPGRVAPVAPTVLPRTATVDKRRGYMAASNGLGLFLGLGVLVLLMKLRDRIDGADDLPNSFQPLVVGTVSNAPANGRSFQGRMNTRILGEEMRLLHANLLPPGPVQRRIMMITSPTPSNGKTSIASQLAMSLAKSGLEVLLIDADLRKRDLSTMFDVGFRPGLADLLQGKPPELIQPVELLPNLRLMGAGSRLDRNPSELFQRRQFHECLNMLHDKFDCIVVDTPPALIVADARLIARSADEVLCVVRAQVSSPKEVNQTIDALARITGKTPKIILNGVAQRQTYYKYKFAYSHDESEAQTPATPADVPGDGTPADAAPVADTKVNP